MLMGTSADGNPVRRLIGDTILQRKSIAPDERKMPTAVINPIRDGNMDAVVFNPSYAPEIKASKISTFFSIRLHSNIDYFVKIYQNALNRGVEHIFYTKK